MQRVAQTELWIVDVQLCSDLFFKPPPIVTHTGRCQLCQLAARDLVWLSVLSPDGYGRDVSLLNVYTDNIQLPPTTHLRLPNHN